MLYDIMCQFWVNFMSRITACKEYLSLPPNVIIKRGIGLFHVHGHVKECYPRYAPTFIRGAGMIDGEVIETLWHVLNHTASSTRAMTWFHRQEYLDAHMADSNWKKMSHIGEQKLCSSQHILRSFVVATLLRKWKACQEQVQDAEIYYDKLCARVGPASVDEYTKEEDELQRARQDDVRVMDALDVKDKDGELAEHFDSVCSIANLWGSAPGKAMMQTTLARDESKASLLQGSSAWIFIGLSLEEQQYVFTDWAVFADQS